MVLESLSMIGFESVLLGQLFGALGFILVTPLNPEKIDTFTTQNMQIFSGYKGGAKVIPSVYHGLRGLQKRTPVLRIRRIRFRIGT